MARIPPDASPAVQEAFRLVWAELEKSKALMTDFSRRRLSNVGDPTQPFDAATKDYVDARLREVS